MNRTAVLIILGALLVVGIIYFSFKAKSPFDIFTEGEMISIEQKWELPLVLEEISAIAYMEEDKIAAVQDEEGIIFIYNLAKNIIEKQIPFAEKGDYEGLSLVGGTAYVLRSDGVIFEIQNYRNNSPTVTQFQTGIDPALNCEGLGYDKKNNQLLISIKDLAGEDLKPVFGFNLQSKKLQKEPVFNINFQDTIFSELRQKRIDRIFRPSEITVHPQTGDIYMLEGTVPKLLVLDAAGKPLKLKILNVEQIPQAEGLTFSPSGEMYISNESGSELPNILKIKWED
ncbi:SdiA-regulated domain-containing protein [Antarcticibacterium sp. 1MA-6-2]|uniref:SdiA-regulated domain-containing protein n=1 Tax=Antarcticibacterium sp. 1MA-6-2 TaxID=2908210 RepID=UPI001F1F4E58|nr:SdiA-regulated domain-containing protein [Antarcticibacterium sp. 1MA-6-2]UJH91567.1 SdiA-regulated domain-containing protein [Antarcticibacterium sp. 1MA-6-2]